MGLPNLPPNKRRQEDPKMTSRKGTASPIKKQNKGVKKEKSFILKNLQKMSLNLAYPQAINK